jgi:hypothetical protein
MKKVTVVSFVAVALSLSGALTAPARQVPAGVPSIVVIDPIGTGQRHQVLVQIDGANYWAEIQGPPQQPQPVNPTPTPAPWQPVPAPVQPDPNLPGPMIPATELGVEAQKYMYGIPAFHQQMVQEIQANMSITAEPQMGKRLVELRNKVGNPLGDALAAALHASGGLDAGGNVINRVKLGKVFDEIYRAQISVLKPRPPHLGVQTYYLGR